MKLDYRYYEGEFLPVILVQLESKDGWFGARAYIDSGASYSLFHADIAEIIGVRLEDGERREMVLGDGDKIIIFIHKIKVRIGDKEFIASIAFSKGLGIGYNILGRKTIFDNFTICFHEKERYVEFN